MSLEHPPVKILVVEDNKKLANFLSRAFTEEGFVVDSAADGRTALKQIEAIAYDLVVLDWMLPGQDGVAVCRELRSRGSRVPILMLTARAEVGERILGLDAGADDYLSKPFDLGELMARARALLRRTQGGDAVTLRLGGFILDRVERTASFDGRTLELTAREFALLMHLAREAGRVVPRSELLAKVWQTSFDPGSNVVEVHVKNLREKLGNEASMIETVRGSGYRLVLRKPNEPST
ncbi:MAG: transcriptional regulator [Myxococcaceae bacterium]|jgi:two-component system OmpR family response regulator|nr:transcriptional regulator [Myxococcaceae bacterium]